jgi:gluconolactonase
MPDPMTTNVCFGGADRTTAFVTLSGHGRLVALEWPRPGLALAH